MNKKYKFLIIFLITFLLLVSCQSKVNEEVDKRKIIAKVNGADITLEDYEKNIIFIGSQYESVFGKDIWNQEIGDGVTYRESFRKEMFDRMITQELVLQAAQSGGITISDSDILNELLSFREKNLLNTEFNRTLEENFIDDEFIKKRFEYELYFEKYKSEILENGIITDDLILNYYNSNSFKFTKEEVKASHILFKTVDENFKALSDAEIENKLITAETILNKINSGANFEQMAIEFSEDDSTASNGGDLGYFKAGEMAQEFDEAAFSLAPGEVSKIIKTIHGYHIIKVYDRVEDTAPIEEVRDGIVAKLQMDIFDEKIKDLYERANIDESRELVEKAGDEND